MTAELGTILGLNAFVVLSVVGPAWFVGRFEGRLTGVERSVEWLHTDMDRLREDVKTMLLRLPSPSRPLDPRVLAERLARLEGAYDQQATKADLASLETRLAAWFAGLLLLVVSNVLGTVTGILITLLG